MERDIIVKLNEWRNKTDRKPLILKGVRQCGKTFILKEFANRYYSDTAYFNFEENPALKKVFEQDNDVKRIIFELELAFGKRIKEDDALIIFDEIQECPKALTSLKYFCENAGGYHIACAGSLLGISINQNASFPVGKVDFLTLYPMSFFEFVKALKGDFLSDHLRSAHENGVPEVICGTLETLLRQYYIVGGMPEAVEKWRTTEDIQAVEDIQQQILTSYQLDFAKHAPINEFPKLSAIWRSIPEQLAKPNSKFIFSHVKKGWRSKDLEDALEWLIGAGLVYKVRKIEKPFMPLSAYSDETSFKLYLSDVGLLRKMAGLPASLVTEAADTVYKEFKGAMTENYVLNELVKSVSENLFYWTSGNSAEVDFVLQCGSGIVPVEVKSEKNTKAKSLSEYRKKYSPEYSVITSMKERMSGHEVLNIPLYLICLIEKICG